MQHRLTHSKEKPHQCEIWYVVLFDIKIKIKSFLLFGIILIVKHQQTKNYLFISVGNPLVWPKTCADMQDSMIPMPPFINAMCGTVSLNL